MPGEGLELGTRRHIPDLAEYSSARGDDPGAVRVERGRGHESAVAVDGHELGTRGCVPDLRRPVQAGGDDLRAIGAE